jgi:hypothetical protein
VAREERRAEHVRGLLEEVAAAAVAITTKIVHLEQARRSWHAVARAPSPRPCRVPRSMPSGDRLERAIRSVRRDVGEVPVSLPRDMTTSVMPYDDPDPAVREAARGRMRETS